MCVFRNAHHAARRSIAFQLDSFSPCVGFSVYSQHRSPEDVELSLGSPDGFLCQYSHGISRTPNDDQCHMSRQRGSATPSPPSSPQMGPQLPTASAFLSRIRRVYEVIAGWPPGSGSRSLRLEVPVHSKGVFQEALSKGGESQVTEEHTGDCCGYCQAWYRGSHFVRWRLGLTRLRLNGRLTLKRST